MSKFSANLTMIFNELDFMDRFSATAGAGFKGVEYLFPYAYDKNELAGQLRQHGLTQVLYNLPAGGWAKGERGIACHPDRVEEFKTGVSQAIEYAQVLGCKRINCLAGIVPQGVSEHILCQTFVDNLRYAAQRLKKHRIKFLIEPINTFDIPNFYLTLTAQALDIIVAVGSDNLFVQYDIYHAQRMEGELGNTLSKHLQQIAHVQLADNPGRNEPGTGEINYAWLFKHIDQIGYAGWIGCEYKPKAKTVDGLGWIKALN